MKYDEFDKLYIKIINRLNSDDVVSQGDIVSLKDIQDACNEKLGVYNKYLIYDVPYIIKLINKNAFSFSRLRKIYPNLTNIKSYVTDTGNVYVRCIFKKEYEVKYILFSKDKDSIEICNSNFEKGEDIEFLKRNSCVLMSILSVLELFVKDYPNVEYIWNKDYRNMLDQDISDNEFISEIHLNHPENTCVTFLNKDEYCIAGTKSYKYGELYDYLEFYKDAFLRKTAVNINDLDPFIKEIVKDYLDNKKTHSIKMTK